MNIMSMLGQVKWLSYEKKISFYPPFLLIGARVRKVSRNPIEIIVHLPLGWRSCNGGGSVFGGCQALVADPIAPIGCLIAFPEYHVWTKGLRIDFLLPGNSDLELRFSMAWEQQAAIQQELDTHRRANPEFEFGLYRKDGRKNARVFCTVAIRKKGYRNMV